MQRNIISALPVAIIEGLLTTARRTCVDSAIRVQRLKRPLNTGQLRHNKPATRERWWRKSAKMELSGGLQAAGLPR
ncbi:MAG: hypothetical protein U5L03_05965 [Burkholderiaceae bacterium]|nr:hypothetical protein [Burkholderiaceae bacterium]